MATTALPPYELLVANFSRPTQSLIVGSDTSNMAPTKTRTGFIFQHIENLGFASDHTNATYGPARSLVTNTKLGIMQPFPPTSLPFGGVTVASDVFAGQSASLFVGPFELVSNRDFVTGGGTAATATNIATAISALPGYTGTPAGSSVTVTGPRGQVGLRFDAAYRGGALNFTFTYTNDEGVLGYSPIDDSPLDPPTILPAGTPNGVAP
jgi:hypothetical protein